MAEDRKTMPGNREALNEGVSNKQGNFKPSTPRNYTPPPPARVPPPPAKQGK